MPKKINKKIFIVEDDKGIIDVYKVAFKAAKINTDFFENGQKAIDSIKDIKSGKILKPALFLIDLILPDMNGVCILREIKGNKETSNIPVFILSNYTIQDSKELDDLKPDKIILKTNITPTQLALTVEKQLNKS